MTKIKTVKERFFFPDMPSIELTISLVLDDTSLLISAVANDNPINIKEIPEEMRFSADVLGDELSEMQTMLIESVRLKLKNIDDEELQKFLVGGHIGLRYVFNEEGK